MGQPEDGGESEQTTGRDHAAAPDDHAAALEAVRLRDAFLLSLAHDLRGSVAAISGASETLRSRAHADGVDALLDLLDEATSAVQIVITNLFDVERIRHGAIEVVRRPTDVPSLLHRAAEDVGLGDRVVVEADVSLADLDVGLTERILWNVLRNAQVHGPQDEPIALCASDEGHHVLLCVEDTGPGIPAEEREAVFEPFQSGSTGQPGTGVGLYLVRELARAQGGDAWIGDRPDGGTAVHVRLPC